ncbi:MAG: ParB/RepB/Spo0J family partition protein [Gemmatimonadota bacterium]|nr:MAG: ParB/RepB/Spo0J family partition protein [Gemmatimonadota bacterium]
MTRRQQKRLGKGLGALLGDYLQEESAEAREFEQLPVAELGPNPFQPRQGLPDESFDDLVASIRENGLLQPVVARPVPGGGWEIVAGERRWRAVQVLGWSHVPAVVRDVDDRTMIVMALIENLQREDLSPLDEAHAYRRLMDEFGLTQGQVAERVGRDRSTVANTIRLLGLPGRVRDLLAAGKISAGHARALLGLEDETRVIQLAQAAAEQGLSVREVEQRVRQGRAKGKRSTPKAGVRDAHSAAYVARAEQALARALGTAVRVKLDGANRGRIEIPFRDAEDFERVVEIIVGVGGVV